MRLHYLFEVTHAFASITRAYVMQSDGVSCKRQHWPLTFRRLLRRRTRMRGSWRRHGSIDTRAGLVSPPWQVCRRRRPGKDQGTGNSIDLSVVEWGWWDRRGAPRCGILSHHRSCCHPKLFACLIYFECFPPNNIQPNITVMGGLKKVAEV